MSFSTTDYPYRTIVQILATFSDHETFQGSGVLIAPDEVLTAAHVVWGSGGLNAATTVSVTPGLNRTVAPYGTVAGSELHYYQINDPIGPDGHRQISNDQTQFDFAVIHLASPVGNTTGYMGYESNFPSGAVHVTGFPGDLGGNVMVDTTTTATRDSNFTIFDLPAGTTSEGDSGGPVWIMQNGSPYAVGTVSSGNSQNGFAGQITTGVFNQIQNWINQDHSPAPAPPTAPAPSPTPAPSIPFPSDWRIVGVGDFNGDGKTDIAYQRSTDNLVEVQLLNGNTPIGGGSIANNPFGPEWTVAGRGDFNGDGKSDLAFRRGDGLTELEFLNGANAAGGGLINPNPFGADWSIIATGDFNGDAHWDLAWQRNSDHLLEIQLLNGVNPVGGGLIANNSFDSSWAIAARGDFNADGRTDLAWRRSDGLTEVQFLNGPAAIGGGLILNSPFGADWTIAGAGDFNGDGFADLVWQRNSDHLVELQFLKGAVSTGGGAIANSPFGADWAVAGVGDFNGDGRADLIYRRADGTTEVQLLNGLTALGGGVTSHELSMPIAAASFLHEIGPG